jgi:hypothetical protein
MVHPGMHLGEAAVILMHFVEQPVIADQAQFAGIIFLGTTR